MTRAELNAHVWADGHWMNTASGRRFPVLDPKPEDFDIVDIAVALGNVARHGGHTRGHYSVAKHSIVDQARAECRAGRQPTRGTVHPPHPTTAGLRAGGERPCTNDA